MIDLGKLQQKFDTFFEEEAEESFSFWLEERLKKEALASLGNGTFESLQVNKQVFVSKPLKALIAFTLKNESLNAGYNTQYATAA